MGFRRLLQGEGPVDGHPQGARRHQGGDLLQVRAGRGEAEITQKMLTQTLRSPERDGSP
nr:hypothetical protein [Streptomyces sp. NRRL F-5123]